MSLVKCKWAAKNRFVINPDGQVWPCCYFANFTYLVDQFKAQGKDHIYSGHKAQMNTDLIRDYYVDPDSKNAFKRPVHEILDDEWFNKTLPETWEKEETIHYQCSKFCRIDNNDEGK